MKQVFVVALVTVSIVMLTKAAPIEPFFEKEDVDQRDLLQVLLSSMLKSSVQAASEQGIPFYSTEDEVARNEQQAARMLPDWPKIGDRITQPFLLSTSSQNNALFRSVLWPLIAKYFQGQTKKQRDEEAKEEWCVCVRSPCPCSMLPGVG